MDDDDLPEVTWEGSFDIMGKVLRCYVLSDGRRIINAEDIESLFNGSLAGTDTENGLLQLAAWCRGH